MLTGEAPANIAFEEAICDSCEGLGTTKDLSVVPRSKACGSCYGTGHAWHLDTSRPVVNRFMPQVAISRENLSALEDAVTNKVISALKDQMAGLLAAVQKEPITVTAPVSEK